MNENKSTYSKNESNASLEQFKVRDELKNLFENCNMPKDELMTQMGLFIRSSYLVKFLVLDDLYNVF